jgi:hypothetical protein
MGIVASVKSLYMEGITNNGLYIAPYIPISF